MNATETKLNVKAADLRSKLFALVNEFKALQMQAHGSGEAAFEAAGQADEVACKLAAIHAELPDLFTDAARDEQDPVVQLLTTPSPAAPHCAGRLNTEPENEMNATAEYKAGEKIEWRQSGKWVNGTILTVTPNGGPDGETVYVIEYLSDDGTKNTTGAKTARLIRRIDA